MMMASGAPNASQYCIATEYALVPVDRVIIRGIYKRGISDHVASDLNWQWQSLGGPPISTHRVTSKRCCSRYGSHEHAEESAPPEGHQHQKHHHCHGNPESTNAITAIDLVEIKVHAVV